MGTETKDEIQSVRNECFSYLNLLEREGVTPPCSRGDIEYLAELPALRYKLLYLHLLASTPTQQYRLS